jgi:hypothetical protein
MDTLIILNYQKLHILSEECQVLCSVVEGSLLSH